MSTFEYEHQLLTTVVTDGKITCSVPSVYPYQETVLMCHFPEDVMVSKKDFTVYYYAPRGSAGNRATVISKQHDLCW